LRFTVLQGVAFIHYLADA